MNKEHASLIIAILLIVGAVVFIYFNNDHNECDIVKTTESNVKGQLVTTTKHNYKEKYSF